MFGDWPSSKCKETSKKLSLWVGKSGTRACWSCSERGQIHQFKEIGDDFFFALMGAWVNILKRHEKCFFSSTPSHTYLTRTKFLGLHPLIFKKFSPHTFHLEKKTEVFSAERSRKPHFFRLHPPRWVDLQSILTCSNQLLKPLFTSLWEYRV